MQNMELLLCSLEYIEQHLREPVKTTDIAAACFCSKSTLEKLFQCVNSISVHDYVIRRRMTMAAQVLSKDPDRTILSVALEFGYNSHEAFARACKEVLHCRPSDLRGKKIARLYPRLAGPATEGDQYMAQRKHVDITELYDLFQERKDCYFVCCDIKSMIPINNISRKAGDLAILTTLERMLDAADEEDVVFRIGGDEFCILTSSPEKTHASHLAEKIEAHNGEGFTYEGKQIPLSLYVVVTRFPGSSLKYNELFTSLHMAIKDGKEAL